MARFRVTASVLNVRAGPGASHDVITRLPNGAVVERLTDTAGPWLRVRMQLSDGPAEGWVSARHVVPIAEEPTESIVDVPWFRVARMEIGISEFPGPDDNPRIVEYHQATSLRAADDEVAWCSAFMNWCMKQAGLTGTGSAAARSWLNWGETLSAPRMGCIVVFRRGSNPSQGHVAIFVRRSGAFLEVLGGNQSNQVKVAPYPVDNVLSYRWPRDIPR